MCRRPCPWPHLRVGKAPRQGKRLQRGEVHLHLHLHLHADAGSAGGKPLHVAQMTRPPDREQIPAMFTRQGSEVTTSRIDEYRRRYTRGLGCVFRASRPSRSFAHSCNGSSEKGSTKSPAVGYGAPWEQRYPSSCLGRGREQALRWSVSRAVPGRDAQHLNSSSHGQKPLFGPRHGTPPPHSAS